MALALAFTEQGGSANGDDIFEGRAIGTASSDRWVVVSFSCNGTATGSCLIGGVSASKSVDTSLGVSFGMLWANVPTGTTADVEIASTSGGMSIHGIWAVTGAASISLVDTDYNMSLSSASFSINVVVDGVTIGTCLEAAGSGTPSWSTGLTNDGVEYSIAGPTDGMSGSTLNGSTTSLSCSFSGTVSPLSWAISFEPVASAAKLNTGLHHVEAGSPLGKKSNGLLHPIRHGIVGWRRGLILPKREIIRPRVTHTRRAA
jgi:hypothetical protein